MGKEEESCSGVLSQSSLDAGAAGFLMENTNTDLGFLS